MAESASSAASRTATHEAVVCGVPTSFVLTAYANRTFVVVSQTGGFGTLVNHPARRSRARVPRAPWHGLPHLIAPTRHLRPAQVHAQRENLFDDCHNPTFSTRVLLGRRDDEMLEVYARTMVELIGKQCPRLAGNPLLLAISITEHSPEMFRAIMQTVGEVRPW